MEDYTTSTYDLLQDEVAGQGDYAFHLATHYNDWFKLTTSIAVESGCKLFFLSRLGWAASDQTATVQVSTNGGASWSSTIWSQAGSDGSGESGFTLKEIDLSAFVGNTIQIRFIFAYNFGTYYLGADAGVGWYVDNIQIGSEFTKDLYTLFGEPTDDEQFYLEYINRARASAATEALRLKNETDPLITSAYSNIGVDVDDIVTQFAWHVSNQCMDEDAQPLPFNSKLLQMARLHSQDMFTNIFQGHVSSANPPSPYQPYDTLGLRATRIGYGGGLGENVYAYSKSIAYGHAGFDVDWGSTTNTASSCYNAAFAGQNMQNPPGHRLHIHNDSYKEIGIGVVNGTNGSVGPQIVTQNFGSGGATVVTGVVYVDSNSNNFYDPGEGVSGVRVDSPSSASYALTAASGGYALPVDGDGSHAVTFSGGGITTVTLYATVSGGRNVKLDHVPSSVGSGYAAWAAALGVTGGETGDHDKDGVPNLIEYVLDGLDPLTPDAHLLPSLVNGTFTVTKNTAATGVTYTVQTSTDMENWVASGYTILTDDANTLSVGISTSAVGQIFVRLLITSS